MNPVTRRTTNFYVENYIEDFGLALKIPTVHERRNIKNKTKIAMNCIYVTFRACTRESRDLGDFL